MQPTPATLARPTWGRRLLDSSLVRGLIAAVSMVLAFRVTMAGVAALLHGRHGTGLPEVAGTVVALLAYAGHVRWIERRAATELRLRARGAELATGLAIGTALVVLVVGGMVAAGAWTITGRGAASGLALASGLAQMVFVGVFEELLSRAILLRLLERAWGTRVALVVSSLLFGLAHLPGGPADALAIAIVVVAGAMLGAAWLVTRNLWLCAGVHIGWNFVLGRVFSVAVSGHDAAPGLVAGRLQGPDWLTGGAFGPEASVVALLVLLPTAALLGWVAHRRGQVLPRPARPSARVPELALAA